MSLIQKIKKYKELKKLKKHNKLFKEGFNWAISSYYIDKNPIFLLEDHIQMSKDFNQYNQFDIGAEYAIELINKKED